MLWSHHYLKYDITGFYSLNHFDVVLNVIVRK